MTAPRVAVVVPVRDGARFLAEALASVLGQTRAPDEVVVVDDGSTDGSGEIAASAGAPVRVIHQEGLGPAAARNRGAAATRAEFLSFLDHDDLWAAEKLAVQSALLDADPGAGLVLGRTRLLVRDGAAWEPAGEPWHALSLGAALVRRATFLRLGALDGARRLCDDVDFLLRAKEAGVRAVLHPEVVQLYRRHGGNLTGDRAGDRRAFLGALRDSLARRRAAGARRDLPSWPAADAR